MTVCLSVCRRPHGPSVMGQTAWTAEVDSVCRQGIRSAGGGGGECGGGEEREGRGSSGFIPAVPPVFHVPVFFMKLACGTLCKSCIDSLYGSFMQ